MYLRGGGRKSYMPTKRGGGGRKSYMSTKRGGGGAEQIDNWLILRSLEKSSGIFFLWQPCSTGFAEESLCCPSALSLAACLQLHSNVTHLHLLKLPSKLFFSWFLDICCHQMFLVSYIWQLLV